MAATPEKQLDIANISRQDELVSDLGHIADARSVDDAAANGGDGSPENCDGDAPANGGDEACWQAWFDGAAQPNPGRIGVGVMLLSPAGVSSALSQRPVVTGCNNEAELLALVSALELGLKAGARRIRLFGDSDFAIRAGQALQRADAPAITEVPRLVALLSRLNELIGRFAAVDLVWIPRHRNGEADRLSRQALGLPHKPAAVPGKKTRPRRRR